MQETWLKPEVAIDGEKIVQQLLQPRYIPMIEEALRSLGDYGEVRLVVERGRLRFLVTQKSYDLLRWRAGEVVKSLEP